MTPSPSVSAGPRLRAPSPRYLPAAAAAVAALQPHQCRWPLGEPAQGAFRFCGADRPGRGSYCRAHEGLAHGASAQRRGRA